ncbi:MAG: phosphotransferase [Gammaproteobacteria bacterium]|nr:phosphotransferase [Gammaproteobacteria bacterium]
MTALSEWAAQILSDSHCTVRPASADASFRRYFRVQTASGATFIVMDAPPDKEDSHPYVRIARRFRALGLNVPEIIAEDLARGFLLISDLGDKLYLQVLNESTVERLYRDAIDALIVLQSGTRTDPVFLPPYDAELLRREMELFRQWYLGCHLSRSLSARHNAVLDDIFTCLIESALEQPKVWVHRDYHSRNLMVTSTSSPGVLDFQDAVHGPITYDLVSLLRDCYVAWPRARVEGWVQAYQAKAQQAGLLSSESQARLLRWFDWMGVQRHLKATGIFARLNHRDGKPGYLNDIPRTLGYVLDVTSRYHELAPLSALLLELDAVPKGRS